MKTPPALRLLFLFVASIAIPFPTPRAETQAAEETIPFPDGSFENGGRGWSIPAKGMGGISTEQAASGERSLKINDASRKSGSNIFSPPLSLPGEGIYSVEGKVFPISGNGLGVYCRFLGRDGKPLGEAQWLTEFGGSDQRWRPFRVTVAAPPQAKAIQLWLHSYNNAVVTACVDDLALRVFAVRRRGRLTQGRKDMQVIKHRLFEMALAGTVSPQSVRRWMKTQAADGHWPDIDYKDQNPAVWKPARHVNRLLAMARAWRRADSPLHDDPKLREAILRAFDFWTRADLRCVNGWYNTIGVPRILYRAMLLTEPILDHRRREAGLKILKNAKLGMTGQNLVWVAEVAIARGCLAGDPWTVRVAFQRMAEEIRITTAEGIQPDYSFHQHGDQLYSGGYGLGFAHDSAFFASLARGTCFRFSREKLRILAHYLLDGEQWMIRDGTFDYSACGREITRKGAATPASLVDACGKLLLLPVAELPRRGEFETFLARLRKPTPANTLVGNRCFWRSDYMVHHRRTFMASVRVTSRRTLQTETCIGENLLGAHLSDGLMYLYRRGDEYRGIFPAWDWKRLPGTTVEITPEAPVTRNGARGKRDFAGGVSDGLYGLAAMDFARGRLTARKSWFFFDDAVVCLGAAISCPTKNPVVTVVNQCLLKSPVRACFNGETVTVSGTATFRGAGWIHHDGVGYLFPRAVRCAVHAEKREGDWYRITHAHSGHPLTRRIFELAIEHGAKPSKAGYEYIVFPGVAAKDMAALAEDWNERLIILRNDGDAQAVRDGVSRVTEIVFWKPGALTIPDKSALRLRADQPCLTLLRFLTDDELEIAAADPSQHLNSLTLRIDGRLWIAKKAAGVRFRRAGDTKTELHFSLPAAGEAGKSVVARLVGKR